MLSFFAFLFLQSDQSLLSPATIAIITAVFTLVVGAIGTAALWNRVHDSSRIKGLWGSLVAAFGIITPYISTFPRGVGIALSVVGLLLALTSARIQGPSTSNSSNQSGRASVGALAVLLMFVMLTVACDSVLTGFKAGIAASKPIAQTLVTNGVISQAQADLVTSDLTAGVDAASRGESCLKGITATGGQKRIAKAKCYYAVAEDLRSILARHNIGGNKLLDEIASIVAAAIEAFEAYSTSVNITSPATGPTGGITRTGAEGIEGANADKDLDSTLKQLNQRLKQAKAQAGVK